LWETAEERTGRGRRSLATPFGSTFRTTLVGLGVLLTATLFLVLFLWPGRGGSPEPAAKALEIKDMHVTHYRGDGNEVVLVGDLEISPEAVHRNDSLKVAADMTVPAYYYLIAFNPKGSADGTIQLCQPEGKDGQGPEAVRPDQRTKVRYPHDVHYFIPDAVGLQAFVLAASTKRLPPFKEWLKEWPSQAGQAPWEGDEEAGAWVWHFDGRELTRLSQVRGRVEPRGGVPESLRKLCEFFKGRAEFEAVQVIAFPVADDRK
jgi:hypothetical protein